ncbi:MAG: hypothetical protein DWQ53_07225 [Microcystis flos-aquae DF17]|uniref:Uncharacterized protein n=1 Tax=Microcystis aeruginosa (strain NIES-843 / IAM M-2473) TaxID=449447 RepID=B0JT17_MICAN|nr:MAG: hypothetical protein DWQ53_07225 [Microcystis flos-aquae DF17]BAG01061.1 unknown protein [Microcystis aeruginosa NIES-843]
MVNNKFSPRAERLGLSFSLMGLRQKTNREKPQLQSPLGIYFEKPKIAETQIYQGKIINRG